MLRRHEPGTVHRIEPLRIDVFIHDERAQESGQLVQQLEAIMAALDDLRREVAESRDVTESAIVLLAGLKEALDAAIASGDPAALVELSAQLDAQSQRLAEAVQANTPTPAPAPDQPPG